MSNLYNQLNSDKVWYDPGKHMADLNPFTQGYGRDRLSFKAEMDKTWAVHYMIKEPHMARGSPYSWIL